jgi:hypothetical protein
MSKRMGNQKQAQAAQNNSGHKVPKTANTEPKAIGSSNALRKN